MLGGAEVPRRELNDEMNSKACGESPSRFFKCSAAASFDRVDEYEMTSFSETSSKGRRRCRRGSAHDDKSLLIWAELGIYQKQLTEESFQSGNTGSFG